MAALQSIQILYKSRIFFQTWMSQLSELSLLAEMHIVKIDVEVMSTSSTLKEQITLLEY